ncbi:hypothetical protein [Helicobacter pylori]|uniref:hypothetical protein n=1 Tax=Helicobacter pylori TaxID=210 RepID=UPI001FB928A9|nr:hypothetical protein [Helicobacter pylori]
MGNLASGHFKPTNKIQEKHNDRTLSPSYLLPKEFRGQNKVNRPSTQAIELKERIIENAKETYLIAFKQKLKSKSYQWSLVVNIKTNTTMSDLEKLAEHFEVKYGFQCYQIAIHRDEGYMDENNQPHINHHAHMEFVTLNKENGKNMWRQINQVKLRQIQTEIAQILGMERGTDKRVSGTERIEPRKYAQMKNKERKELEAKDKELNTLKQEKTNLKDKLQEKDKTINKLQERPTTEQYSQLEQANSEQAQTIQEKDKEIATLNTINAKLEKTNKDLQRPSMWDTIKESIATLTDKATGNTKREIEELEKKVANKEYSLDFYRDELQKVQQERDALKKEIATALDTTNEHFKSKAENLQEAVERNKSVTEQYFLLDLLYNDPNFTNEYTNKLVEKHKHGAVFTKLWNAIKLLYNIVEKLFGDKNAKKDHQDILNTISELQERPTKQQLEAKEKELNTLKQDKTTLTNKLQEQEKTINELNQFKNSSNLALDLEKAQERIQTLESNEIAYMHALSAKESTIQSKGRTINRLKKELKELEDKYRLERERMVAENKRLKEQGLEKTYTQKDYEDLKKAHHQEVEELKKEIQEQETYTPTKRM